MWQQYLEILNFSEFFHKFLTEIEKYEIKRFKNTPGKAGEDVSLRLNLIENK